MKSQMRSKNKLKSIYAANVSSNKANKALAENKNKWVKDLKEELNYEIDRRAGKGYYLCELTKRYPISSNKITKENIQNIIKYYIDKGYRCYAYMCSDWVRVFISWGIELAYNDTVLTGE